MDHDSLRGPLRSIRGPASATEPLWLYLQSHEGVDRWLHVRCPCGCGETVSLNLLENESPFWSLTWHRDGTLSLSPAVWNGRGCGSCFSIERGEACRVSNDWRAQGPSTVFPAERVRPWPATPSGVGPS
jgi:hypothetical protein